MAEHYLKTWPEFFNAVLDGSKPFEIRKADREFDIEDVLILQEFEPDSIGYTGRICRKRVTYILNGGKFGLATDYVCMGLDEDN